MAVVMMVEHVEQRRTEWAKKKKEHMGSRQVPPWTGVLDVREDVDGGHI